MWFREGVPVLFEVFSQKIFSFTNDSFPYPQIIIVLFGVVGLGWGYTIQQFSQTVRL